MNRLTRLIFISLFIFFSSQSSAVSFRECSDLLCEYSDLLCEYFLNDEETLPSIQEQEDLPPPQDKENLPSSQDEEDLSSSQEQEDLPPPQEQESLPPPQDEEDLFPPKDQLDQKCLKPLGIFSLADQINQSMLGIGLSETKKFVKTSDSCFPYFYAPFGGTAWVEPLIFHAKNSGNSLDCVITTLGLKSGAEWTFGDILTIGGGVGYYHSWLEKQIGVDGVFFGPSISASSGRGFLSLTLFWSYNCFGGKLKLCDKNRKIDHHSWNQTVRIEGGWKLSLPKTILGGLSFYPFGKLDFIQVSESSYQIKSIGEVHKHESRFVDFDLGTKVSKTIVCSKNLLVLPSILFGIHSSQPTLREKIKVSDMKIPFDPKGRVQFLFDAEISTLVQKRVLIGIRYQSRSGGNAPLKGGNVRMEWNF